MLAYIKTLLFSPKFLKRAFSSSPCDAGAGRGPSRIAFSQSVPPLPACVAEATSARRRPGPLLHQYLLNGARPSSAAETSARSSGSDCPNITCSRYVSASEDGRTPLNTYLHPMELCLWSRLCFAWALIALAALTGCSSSSDLSPRLTRVPSAYGGASSLPAKSVSPTNSPVVRPADRAATGLSARVSPGQDELDRAAPPVSPHLPTGGPQVNDWVSLQRWSGTNHIGAPQRLLSTGNLTYEIRTACGAISVTAGSLQAHLDGLNYWLGYPPRWTNGELFIHILDAQKNLLPLARRSTLPHETNPVVVIDPGHGGENTGARSVRDNRFEKDFALDWALRLRPLLEGRGWKVYLTRTNDMDLFLPARVALAADRNASLFLSLHFNSAARSDQSGLETYCLTPAGLPSTLTRDYEDDAALVFPNNAFDIQNLQYALRLHRALVETTGGVDRGVRRARFMGVLRTQNRPAVLIEGGYLSNSREAQLIGQPEYRQKLAEAVANALQFTHEAPIATNGFGVPPSGGSNGLDRLKPGLHEPPPVDAQQPGGFP